MAEIHCDDIDDDRQFGAFMQALLKHEGPFSVLVSRACIKCKTGTYKPSGTPNWQNRMTCDECNHHVSR